MLSELIEKQIIQKNSAVVCGPNGIGKTTLACNMPKPIVIKVEEGMQSIPADKRPDCFPILQDVPNLWQYLNALIKDDHDYQTLVIDSITALDRLFVDYIIDSDPKQPKSINQALGGYGAGLSAVGALHERLVKATRILQKSRGMNIVFVAHVDTETMDLPDTEPYTRYSLRLNKKSQAPYLDDSDLVAFIKLKTHLIGEDGKKKAISSGERVICCQASASNVSKNRFGITKDIPFDINTEHLLLKIMQHNKPQQKETK